jgi:hypothetical protein
MNQKWYIERIVLLVAGVFNLTGLSLAFFISPYFLLLSLLVGINLTIYSLTGFCLMSKILAFVGVKTKAQCSL